MTNKVIGEVSWETVGSKHNNEGGGKDSWMRLEDGQNTVRVVTNPHQYLVHKGVKRVGDKGFGEKVNCSIDECPLCKAGHPVSTRWYIGVIDRKSNSFKILDAAGSIVFGLKELNKNVRWGDVKKFDVDLIKNSKADPQHFYSVQPVPHTPLSAADQKIIDEADLDYLKKKTVAPTPEQVKERMDKVLEGHPLFIPPVQSKKSTSKKAVTAVAQEVDMNGSDDGDDLFQSYNSTTTS